MSSSHWVHVKGSVAVMRGNNPVKHRKEILSSKRSVRLGKGSRTGVGTSFATDLVEFLSETYRYTLDDIKDNLLLSGVYNGTFSIYTGVLINSYMVGAFLNGKMVRGSCIGASPGITGYDISDEVGYEDEYKLRQGVQFIYMKEQRNPKSRKKMRFDEESFSEDGYGQDFAKLSGYTPSVRNGYEIVLTNGAPYAEKVQMQNAGSNVMPTKSVASQYVSVVRSELQKAVVAYRKGVAKSMSVHVGVTAGVSAKMTREIVKKEFAHCKRPKVKSKKGGNRKKR